MFPVLFSIGKIAVSSFGVFLALGFLIGVFLIWRLSRAWDLDEEKILDLTLLTFLGGLIGSRLYFVLGHLSIFASHPFNILFFNKVPGFSFWGAILGGWWTIYLYAKRKNADFWLLLDIASVGLLGGLILTNLGCFLGGCNVGKQSNLFLAVNMVGFLGKRFPTQLLEAFLMFLVLLTIWSLAVHFHPRGKIVGLTLIYIGLIKFLMEPLKASHNEGLFLSLSLLSLGLVITYKVTKRNIVNDLKNLLYFTLNLFTNPQIRKSTLARLYKYWYNQKTLFSWKLRSLKKLLRRINVRFAQQNT